MFCSVNNDDDQRNKRSPEHQTLSPDSSAITRRVSEALWLGVCRHRRKEGFMDSDGQVWIKSDYYLFRWSCREFTFSLLTERRVCLKTFHKNTMSLPPLEVFVWSKLRPSQICSWTWTCPKNTVVCSSVMTLLICTFLFFLVCLSFSLHGWQNT